MGPIDRPETSVHNYLSMLRKIAENRRSNLDHYYNFMNRNSGEANNHVASQDISLTL